LAEGVAMLGLGMTMMNNFTVFPSIYPVLQKQSWRLL